MGYAHSVEAYHHGRLVGGLYGVAIGSAFCGESMFAHESDASKVAFAVLVDKLKEWGFDFIDCQVPTEHLKSLGAVEVARDYYLMLLEKALESDNLWGGPKA
jgi:leucyl/phenylalanyl-tRNA--protein transferase